MVGIVILDFNNAEDTIRCIESVIKFTPKCSYKLFVVENGSQVETVKAVERFFFATFGTECAIVHDGDVLPRAPFATLLISKSNDGYARGNNKALRLFDKDDDIDHVMILNNDILFVEDIVTPLTKYVEELPDCGIVSPILLKRDGSGIDHNCARKDYNLIQFFWEYLFSFIDLFGLISKYENRRHLLLNRKELEEKDFIEIELPSGSCMFLKKNVFREIGYFDSQTFLYFEENILYRKMQKIGLKNYLTPRLRCIHIGSVTTTKQKTSHFLMKCQMESTAYYLKHYRNSSCMALYVICMSHLTLLKINIQSMLRK